MRNTSTYYSLRTIQAAGVRLTALISWPVWRLTCCCGWPAVPAKYGTGIAVTDSAYLPLSRLATRLQYLYCLPASPSNGNERSVKEAVINETGSAAALNKRKLGCNGSTATGLELLCASIQLYMPAHFISILAAAGCNLAALASGGSWLWLFANVQAGWLAGGRKWLTLSLG